jgi:hypothetical protein
MSQNMHDLLQQARADALSEAPPMRRDVEQVVAAGRSRVARGRLLRLGAGAGTAAAVAAAIALPHAFAGPSAPHAVAASAPVPASPAAGTAVAAGPAVYPRSEFQYGFKGYRAGVFTVSAPVLVTPGYQESYVRRGAETFDLYDGDRPDRIAASAPGSSARLTVFRPGAFQPTRFAGGEAVRVGDRPGLYAPGVHYEPGDDSPSRGALAWQYADNAWATVASVTADGYSKAEFLQIAAGLTAAPATAATVPLKLGWVPAGYRLTSVGATDDFPSGAVYMVSSLRLIVTRPAYTGLTATVDAAATGSPTVRVSVYPVEFTDASHRQPGRAAYCNPGNPHLCYRMTADGRYLVEADSDDALTSKDLLGLLDGAALADPARPSTWFPVHEAVPGASG